MTKMLLLVMMMMMMMMSIGTTNANHFANVMVGRIAIKLSRKHFNNIIYCRCQKTSYHGVLMILHVRVFIIRKAAVSLAVQAILV